MKAYQRVMASTPLLLALGACSSPEVDPDVAHTRIGPGGGIITSVDSVLTIAIPPGALEEDHDFFIEATNEPPDVYGQAYLVRPNPVVRYDVTVTYRDDLPEDPSGIAVGAVDSEAFEGGNGNWESLPVLRVDVEDKLVGGVDDGISIFYGLVDDGG